MANSRINAMKLARGTIAILPSLTTLRTVPDLSNDLIKSIDIANNSTSYATVALYLVPSGGTADDTNRLIPTVRIAPRSVFQWTGLQVLESGGTIQAGASVASVTVHVSGGNEV